MRPAIPGTGARSNGSTASPPPAFNFAVLPDVKGRGALLEIKRRAIETQQLAADPDYKAIEMPRNSPTGFITAFFCDGHRLRADLAHPVDGRPGPCLRLCGLCLVRLARRGRIRNSGERGCTDRRRKTRRAREEWLAPQRQRERGRHDGDNDSASCLAAPGLYAGADAHRPWRRRTRLQARDRRLRLLDFSAQRHRDVLRIFRGARRAAKCDGRRPVRRAIFSSAGHRDRNGLPALLELHLRAFGGRRRGAQHALDPGGAVRHGAPGPGVSSFGGARVHRDGRGRRWAAAQRVSVVVFRRSSAVTARVSAPGCCGSAP